MGKPCPTIFFKTTCLSVCDPKSVAAPFGDSGLYLTRNSNSSSSGAEAKAIYASAQSLIFRIATWPALNSGRGPLCGIMKKLQTVCVCLLTRVTLKLIGNIGNFGMLNAECRTLNCEPRNSLKLEGPNPHSAFRIPHSFRFFQGIELINLLFVLFDHDAAFDF